MSGAHIKSIDVTFQFCRVWLSATVRHGKLCAAVFATGGFGDPDDRQSQSHCSRYDHCRYRSLCYSTRRFRLIRFVRVAALPVPYRHDCDVMDKRDVVPPKQLCSGERDERRELERPVSV